MLVDVGCVTFVERVGAWQCGVGRNCSACLCL